MQPTPHVPGFFASTRARPWLAPVGRGENPPRAAHFDLRPCDRDFVAMCVAYRDSGGVARGSELASRMDGQDGHGDARLARLIVSGEIFSFEWSDCVWVPMFQLDAVNLTPASAAGQVRAKLSADFDGWSLAVWFARPNPWLCERRPVDLLASALPLVLQAARFDRHVAVG